MLKYDLLAIDLDGTLLDRRGRVSPRNAAAVRAARDAGLEVVIATGRALVESEHVLDAIEHRGAFVGAGGALLCDAATRRTVERSVMPADLVRRLTGSLGLRGHLAHLLKDRDETGYDYLIVGEGVLDPATEWWFDTLPVVARRVATFDDDEHPDHTLRCGTVAAAAEIADLAGAIRSSLGDSVYMQHWAAVTSAEPINASTHMLEVFNPRVDKWTMLDRYATRRAIRPERIAAIGDGINDIGMIRAAGLGIAVGNADPGVMHVASRVVAEHHRDGVAEAIERLVNGTW